MRSRRVRFDQRAVVLRGVFPDLDEWLLDHLARSAHEAVFPAGAVIVREGEPGDTFFIIVDGRVRVTKFLALGTERVLNELGPGHFFGEMALVEEAARVATVTARDNVSVLTINHHDFQELLTHNAPAGLAVMCAVVHRFRDADRHAIEELRDKNLELARAYAELAEATRRKSEFLTVISHELRTPLTAIRGYAETLLDGAIDDAEHNRKFLEVIRSNAIRLTNIASDLLVLSELEQHRPLQEPAEPVPVQPVIESAIRTVESAARLRQIRITAEPADYCVRALRFRLEQALVNLVDNAVKFSPPGTEVRIACNRTDGGMVEIHVIDQGIGIPEADLPRIFERFYRVDKARSREAGGTGLGLSIVKHIAELFGGSVRVKSRLNEGSTFTLCFPAA